MSEVSDHTAAARPIRLRMPFGQRGWLISAFALITAGIVFNWGWLTALGLAPLILSLAPCAAMCAVGACAMCKSKSCDSKTTPAGGSGSAASLTTSLERNNT